ncbi:hypothetical protein ACP70R_046888 [Stipagrostis hirtigluma subsp. patula]
MAPRGHNILDPPLPSLPPSSSSLRRRALAHGDTGLAVRRRHGRGLPGVAVSAASEAPTTPAKSSPFLTVMAVLTPPPPARPLGDATPSGYACTICCPSSNLDTPLILQQHSVDARPPVLSVGEAVRRHPFSASRDDNLVCFLFPFFASFRLQLQLQL